MKVRQLPIIIALNAHFFQRKKRPLNPFNQKMKRRVLQSNSQTEYRNKVFFLTSSKTVYNAFRTGNH